MSDTPRKKSLNSRAKGQRGEREWAKFLRDHGLRARRGVQYQGGPQSPDVVCDALPGVHFEVKRVEALSLYMAMAQACDDAGRDKTPVVAHRRNGEEWLVVMRAVDWLEFMEFWVNFQEALSYNPDQTEDIDIEELIG